MRRKAKDPPTRPERFEENLRFEENPRAIPPAAPEEKSMPSASSCA
jgi:hypothetical protein